MKFKTRVKNQVRKVVHKAYAFYGQFLGLPDTKRRSIIFGVLIILVTLTWLINTLLTSPSEFCVKKNGNWLEDYNECENITQRECKAIGGSYSSCSNPCRHGKFTVCLDKCIEVCKLD